MSVQVSATPLPQHSTVLAALYAFTHRCSVFGSRHTYAHIHTPLSAIESATQIVLLHMRIYYYTKAKTIRFIPGTVLEPILLMVLLALKVPVSTRIQARCSHMLLEVTRSLQPRCWACARLNFVQSKRSVPSALSMFHSKPKCMHF